MIGRKRERGQAGRPLQPAPVAALPPPTGRKERLRHIFSVSDVPQELQKLMLLNKHLDAIDVACFRRYGHGLMFEFFMAWRWAVEDENAKPVWAWVRYPDLLASRAIFFVNVLLEDKGIDMEKLQHMYLHSNRDIVYTISEECVPPTAMVAPEVAQSIDNNCQHVSTMFAEESS